LQKSERLGKNDTALRETLKRHSCDVASRWQTSWIRIHAIFLTPCGSYYTSNPANERGNCQLQEIEASVILSTPILYVNISMHYCGYQTTNHPINTLNDTSSSPGLETKTIE
jgi:hypothetical protein